MLAEDGYILLKNKIPANDLNFEFTLPPAIGSGGIEAKGAHRVNYSKLKYFIDNIYFPRVSTSTPYYGKFRYSNNTNGKDAAVLHGDTYNHTDENTIGIYTCLLYFDEAEMELIPFTHKKDYVNSLSASELFHKRIKIKMDPGDVLIFHSNLHHRGVGYNTLLGNGIVKSRRLLQIFDVCFTKEEYEKYFTKLKVVMTGNSALVKLQNSISGESSGPGELLSLMNYFLVRHDYQYRSILIDIPQSEKKGSIISYEPGRRAIYREYANRVTNITSATSTSAPRSTWCNNYIDDENINVITDDLLEKNSKPISNFKVYLLLLIIVLVVAYRLRK
jgi:hypothetical protein